MEEKTINAQHLRYTNNLPAPTFPLTFAAMRLQ